jgi:ArsR family transcriptional regulator
LRYIERMTATEFFSALADDTRLRCLVLLSRHAELCVCELTHALGASQAHISRHLAQLRELAIVTDRREGLWVYYGINPALPPWAKAVLEETASEAADSSPFAEDEAALTAMANRPSAARCA